MKHLLIDWRRGAEWFWDTLVDADYGNNGQNWQWIAGTGVDSQPFVRIMAPTLQSSKFAAADYIRRWVPELRKLRDEDIHEPAAPRPSGYAEPIVEHRTARERALHANAMFSDGAGARQLTSRKEGTTMIGKAYDDDAGAEANESGEAERPNDATDEKLKDPQTYVGYEQAMGELSDAEGAASLGGPSG